MSKKLQMQEEELNKRQTRIEEKEMVSTTVFGGGGGIGYCWVFGCLGYVSCVVALIVLSFLSPISHRCRFFPAPSPPFPLLSPLSTPTPT